MRPAKIMRKEILPNLVAPLMVEAGLRLTYSIIIIAGLAFLGFGQAPPAANWGTMINDNRVGLSLNPWAVIAPAVIPPRRALAASRVGPKAAGGAVGQRIV